MFPENFRPTFPENFRDPYCTCEVISSETEALTKLQRVITLDLIGEQTDEEASEAARCMSERDAMTSQRFDCCRPVRHEVVGCELLDADYYICSCYGQT
jgi:hypothetical protein